MNGPNGCNFGPRCDYFEEGRCNAADIAMSEIAGDDRHAVALFEIRGN
jgi:peptide/nickel transport system ATP-binding protein